MVQTALTLYFVIVIAAIVLYYVHNYVGVGQFKSPREGTPLATGVWLILTIKLVPGLFDNFEKYPGGFFDMKRFWDSFVGKLLILLSAILVFYHIVNPYIVKQLWYTLPQPQVKLVQVPAPQPKPSQQLRPQTAQMQPPMRGQQSGSQQQMVY